MNIDFNPSGFITLTTDFGAGSPYAGIMEGAIYNFNLDARVIHLTHNIPKQNVLAAGIIVSRNFQYFPEGTVHVSVVDPGVGSKRKILIAAYKGHFFIVPDNGLLTDILSKSRRIYSLKCDKLTTHTPSHTFHGRDFFAPAAAMLAGGISPEQIGKETPRYKKIKLNLPRCINSKITGAVLFFDDFGNAVTNIPEELLECNQRANVILKNHPETVFLLKKTFSGVPVNKPVAYIGSMGLLELGIRNGNLKSLMNLNPNISVSVYLL